MLVFLPFTAWGLLFLLFYQHHCWRSSVLLSAITWGVMVTAIVEILSIFTAVSFWSMAFVWMAINLALGFLCFKQSCKKSINFGWLFQIPLHLIFLVSGIGFIVITIGIIAIIAPPNTWDAMTYHMPRVMYWIQNRTVAHYPTNYLPQLYHSPWSEFAIMNLQILSGGDRFANLVQWFSMIGSLIGVSLIARELGASLSGQIFSAVFAATLPMGILQASSAKNDYVVAFWLVCLAYFVLVAILSRKISESLLPIGSSLGLALFTKGTAYLYAFPFYLWFLIESSCLFRPKFLKVITLISGVSILINLGHYSRNFDLFNTIIFSPAEYKIDEITLPTFIANVLRNMALHLSIPLDGFRNDFIENLIIQIHSELLKVDINDPRITSPGVLFGIQSASNHEATAGNPFHFYLILLAIFTSLSLKGIRRQPEIIKYGVCVICAILFFCLMIKWQPFQSRLHLPIFLLFSSFVGRILEGIFKYRFITYAATFLVFISGFWLFFNESRPIIAESNIFNTSRVTQYFMTRLDLRDDFVGAAQIVKDRQCDRVGLSLEGDQWEYPLWVLLKQNGNSSIQIKQINIDNISKIKQRQFSYDQFSPCAIIDLGTTSQETMMTEFGRYQQAWVNPFRGSLTQPLRVYVKRDPLS